MFDPADLPLLHTFARVARAGSFTAAARELSVAKSVVSRQIRLLEERCALRLIERTTRSVQITQAGERLLEIAADLEATRAAVDELTAQEQGRAVGTLRVAGTVDLSVHLLAPVCARLAVDHPDLRVDVVGDDGMRDLVAERFDVAVRLGVPRDAEYVMRKLAAFDEPIFAAPALAAAYERASRPSDLSGAPWVQHSVLAGLRGWRLTGPAGEEGFEVRVRAQANNGEGVRALLVGGAGLAGRCPPTSRPWMCVEARCGWSCRAGGGGACRCSP